MLSQMIFADDRVLLRASDHKLDLAEIDPLDLVKQGDDERAPSDNRFGSARRSGRMPADQTSSNLERALLPVAG
jgi:hypothetical protein